jgi:hypothetical protein
MAGGNAVTAMIALSDRMGIVATGAVEIAALQKDDQPVARPIHARICEDLTDRSPD